MLCHEFETFKRRDLPEYVQCRYNKVIRRGTDCVQEESQNLGSFVVVVVIFLYLWLLFVLLLLLLLFIIFFILYSILDSYCLWQLLWLSCGSDYRF